MEGNIFSIEVICQGKYETWDFRNEEARDELYRKIQEQFRSHAIADKEEEVDDTQILQLSATNLKIEADGKVDQQVPYEWYTAEKFEEFLSYINNEYPKY